MVTQRVCCLFRLAQLLGSRASHEVRIGQRQHVNLCQEEKSASMIISCIPVLNSVMHLGRFFFHQYQSKGRK